MKMKEVGFHEPTITDLMVSPLIRDNIKGLECDFNSVYSKLLNAEMPEEVSDDDLIKMKSDLFEAFCYGALTATKVDSEFRRTYKLPKEFDPTDEIMANSKKLIL